MFENLLSCVHVFQIWKWVGPNEEPEEAEEPDMTEEPEHEDPAEEEGHSAESHDGSDRPGKSHLIVSLVQSVTGLKVVDGMRRENETHPLISALLKFWTEAILRWVKLYIFCQNGILSRERFKMAF